MIASILLTITLAVFPVTQQVDQPQRVSSGEHTAKDSAVGFDLRAAIDEAALRVVAEDAGVELVWIQEPGGEEDVGYWVMMLQNTIDPAVLMYFAASVAEIYSASDLRTQCDESTIIECSNPFPNTAQQDALITAGVYAGVTALQRLAKTQWDVDMDEGWKNLLIWGGMATVRAIIAGQNMSDANALRDLGR